MKSCSSIKKYSTNSPGVEKCQQFLTFMIWPFMNGRFRPRSTIICSSDLFVSIIFFSHATYGRLKQICTKYTRFCKKSIAIITLLFPSVISLSSPMGFRGIRKGHWCTRWGLFPLT